MGSTGVTGVVIAVAVLALVLYRQTVARPVSPRRLIILPGLLIVVGVIALSNVHHGHLTGTEVTYVAADLVWSVASGVGRGLCVRVFPRDGVMWRQGTAVTIALWLVSIAGRVVIAVLASRAGVPTSATPRSTSRLASACCAKTGWSPSVASGSGSLSPSTPPAAEAGRGQAAGGPTAVRCRACGGRVAPACR